MTISPKLRSLVQAGLLVMLLSGCDQEVTPIAPEYSDFVGVWENGMPEGSDYHFLQITASGYLIQAQWHRQDGVTNCTIINRLPVKTLSESQINASAYWIINVDLSVDSPPEESNGSLLMTVDGDPMIKTDDRREGFDFKWECGDDGLIRVPVD